MRPRVAPLAFAALAVLVLSPAARAVPITGYAVGTVLREHDARIVGFPRFAVGSPVYVRYTYDLDPATPLPHPFGQPHVRLEFQAGGITSGAIFSFTRAVVDGDSLFLEGATNLAGSVLRMDGDSGTFEWSVDLGGPTGGFLAAVTRVADDSTFPTPEPSTLVMGLVGAGLLGIAWNRRRRAA
jgi:hypothetical protein